jgi:prephenate dehydrogenase
MSAAKGHETYKRKAHHASHFLAEHPMAGKENRANLHRDLQHEVLNLEYERATLWKKDHNRKT